MQDLAEHEIDQMLACIDLYELPEPHEHALVEQAHSRVLGLFGAAPQAAAIDASQAGAAVVNNVVLSFVAGMSQQAREDVNDIFLYASLAATKKFPDKTQGEEWFHFFLKVMRSFGWLATGTAYNRYETTDTKATIADVALKILETSLLAAALPAATSVMMLSVATSALKTLQSKDGAPKRLFQRSTEGNDAHQFAVGSCVQAGDSNVAVVISFMAFERKKAPGQVLCFEWDLSSVQLCSGMAKIEFSARNYGRVRERIQEALTDHMLGAIEQFPI
ncbi:hypothetical protein [Pseudomonas sp. nanlin1]|uniref:hypothetical protein n=1 Tax=Pseudomonas sp. nanlin1 TaxID=3040605 RepID=UPI00388DF932